MTFTDDDLNRLKDKLKMFDNGWNWQECGLNQTVDFKALLARLEASEKVCVGIENTCKEHNLQGQAKKDLEAWRKACGK